MGHPTGILSGSPCPSLSLSFPRHSPSPLSKALSLDRPAICSQDAPYNCYPPRRRRAGPRALSRGSNTGLHHGRTRRRECSGATADGCRRVRWRFDRTILRATSRQTLCPNTSHRRPGTQIHIPRYPIVEPVLYATSPLFRFHLCAILIEDV
ncbi:hypothetical protein BD779DRAFT_1537958 [Infundibulicybe gibba]|nr:hypothetical protein BD779DRAFT_1537958 [Infundibulicybe gibba]